MKVFVLDDPVVRRNRSKAVELLARVYDHAEQDLTTALQSLMALFAEHLSTLSADIATCVKSKVTEWMNSQAVFILALFENICWES